MPWIFLKSFLLKSFTHTQTHTHQVWNIAFFRCCSSKIFAFFPFTQHQGNAYFRSKKKIHFHFYRLVRYCKWKFQSPFTTSCSAVLNNAILCRNRFAWIIFVKLIFHEVLFSVRSFFFLSLFTLTLKWISTIHNITSSTLHNPMLKMTSTRFVFTFFFLSFYLENWTICLWTIFTFARLPQFMERKHRCFAKF